jgi:predicted RNA binding protein YcfA (HicA-like mRNA interferase family)
MPKFAGLSGKDIVRALEKLGFQVADNLAAIS